MTAIRPGKLTTDIRSLRFMVVVTAALLVVGCTTDGRERPLSGPRSAVSVCATQNKATIYFGTMPVESDKAPGATITEVSLVDAKTVELRDTYLVPNTGAGVGTTRHPDKTFAAGWDWPGHVAATGAVLPHDGTVYDLLVGVARTAPEAHLAGVRVEYTFDGKRYFWVYPVSLSLTDGRCQSGGW